MTQDDRKTWYLTGGVSAAIGVIVIALWFAGVFEAPAVLQ